MRKAAQKRAPAEDDTRRFDLDITLETIQYEYVSQRVRETCEGGYYTMSLTGRDAKLVERAVNQGIDSRLQACYFPAKGDCYEFKQGEFVLRLECRISPDSLPVLLRRLACDVPFSEDEDSDWEAAQFLVKDILEGLETELNE